MAALGFPTDRTLPPRLNSLAQWSLRVVRELAAQVRNRPRPTRVGWLRSRGSERSFFSVLVLVLPQLPGS
jgi:hypothetical protein